MNTSKEYILEKCEYHYSRDGKTFFHSEKELLVPYRRVVSTINGTEYPAKIEKLDMPYYCNTGRFRWN